MTKTEHQEVLYSSHTLTIYTTSGTKLVFFFSGPEAQ